MEACSYFGIGFDIELRFYDSEVQFGTRLVKFTEKNILLFLF